MFSHVAGERVELTAHKESVVVEKIKRKWNLDLVMRNLFMTEVVIETWNLMKSNSIQVLHNRI